jgi:CBS domain-containing protein
MMTVGEVCNRDVVIANRDESVLTAAQLMREHHVGDVVVVSKQNNLTVPVGMVTDRDIVLELVAKSVDVRKVSVGDVMSEDLLLAREDDSVENLVAAMQNKGVRRVPVVNETSALVGIIVVDDLVDLLAEQLTRLVGLIQREAKREHKTRQV